MFANWPSVPRKLLCIAVASVVLSSCGSGGGGDDDDDPATNPDVPETPVTTVSISGKATANPTDLSSVLSFSDRMWRGLQGLNPLLSAVASSPVSDDGADGNSALPEASVSLYKVFADGRADEQVNIGDVTTASDGTFTIADVEPVPESSGSGNDFYYEVRISKSSGSATLNLSSPVAPTADISANVTPETNLAADVLKNVALANVEVPGVELSPLPSSDIINGLRELAVKDIADLQNQNSINLPSALGAAENLTLAANGVAAAGGETEKMFKAIRYESEHKALSDNLESISDTDAAGYLKRVIRESCNQDSNIANYMPQAAAEALASYFRAGNTTTPTDIINAYNGANGVNPDLDAAAVVTLYKTVLANIESNYAASASEASGLSNAEQIALFTKRNLASASFTADTPLDMDQAAAFIQLLGANQADIENGNVQCGQALNNIDFYSMIASVTGNSALDDPRVSEMQAYNVSAGGCSAGFVPLSAEVYVYQAGKTVSSVVLDSSEASSFPNGGTLTLSLDGQRWRSNPFGGGSDFCVKATTQQTITATVTFSDSSTVTESVERNFPVIEEPDSEFMVDGSFVDASSSSINSPVVVDDYRPLYRWTDPDTLFTQTANRSDNTTVKSALQTAYADGKAKIKYTYEMSHMTPSSMGPESACSSVEDHRLYDVNSFIPTIDCEVNTCAASLAVSVDQVRCRYYVQAFLVDESDNILAQAAGNFRFFCVDKDGDGDCGL